MKPHISIFNDVIGPVMRGPSSAHTAAGWRVANMSIQILDDPLKSATIEFDRDGQWATNYEEQGTVLGMNGGLLDIDMADDQMKNAEQTAEQRGISIHYSVSSFENNHPNSMLVSLSGQSGRSVQLLAASLGGGSFILQTVDGFSVSMNGDFHIVLLWAHGDMLNSLQDLIPPQSKLIEQKLLDKYLYIFESAKTFSKTFVDTINTLPLVDKISVVAPIMPIVSGSEISLGYSDIASLLSYSKSNQLSLGELGLMYENIEVVYPKISYY